MGGLQHVHPRLCHLKNPLISIEFKALFSKLGPGRHESQASVGARGGLNGQQALTTEQPHSHEVYQPTRNGIRFFLLGSRP